MEEDRKTFTPITTPSEYCGVADKVKDIFLGGGRGEGGEYEKESLERKLDKALNKHYISLVRQKNGDASAYAGEIDSVMYSVMQKFAERANVGMKKYGTNLDRDDLSILEWIQHAQEEHMDAILYLEKLKIKVASIGELLDTEKNK